MSILCIQHQPPHLKFFNLAVGICLCLLYVCVFMNFNNLNLFLIGRILELVWIELLQPIAKSFWLHSFQNVIKKYCLHNNINLTTFGMLSIITKMNFITDVILTEFVTYFKVSYNPPLTKWAFKSFTLISQIRLIYLSHSWRYLIFC